MFRFQKILLQQGDYSCEILANYGAALQSYQYKGLECIAGYEHEDELEAQAYKGVVLAPFPNRVEKANYTFENTAYVLPINRAKEGLALHGFLYNKVFQVENQTENCVQLNYHYMGDVVGFPFPFQLNIFYFLTKEGALHIKTAVLNTGKLPLPFGTGWHPYFQLGETIDALQLDFPACQQMELLPNLIPTGKLLPFLEKSTLLHLKECHWDDCFYFEKEQEAKFVLKSAQLDLHIENESGYPYFQIFTPKDRKSIAIEPMSCAPNAFNNKLGIAEIAPVSQQVFSYKIFAQAHT